MAHVKGIEASKTDYRLFKRTIQSVCEPGIPAGKTLGLACPGVGNPTRAGSSRDARCPRIVPITAGSSMLAMTLTLPPALLAGLDHEDPLQPLRPRHGPVALGGRAQVRRLGLPPPRRRHLGPPPAVRREHAVVSRQVRPRSRHQRRQARDEVQRR